MKASYYFVIATLALAAPVLAQEHPHETVDPHAGHQMPGDADSEMPEAGNESPPVPPTDNAADRLFSIDEMDSAREQLRREHGGARVAMLLLNLAEYQVRSRSDGYRWDGEGWFGGDWNRLVVKSEGEGTVDDRIDDAEVQLLYSRAVSPYFDVQAGVRHDFNPLPSRTYGTIAFEGLAPYWFEVEGALFLSERADLLGRLEGYYDQPITQRLVIQPRVELNFAAQDVRENEIGSGLSDLELGLRLRYEIRREFAPYLGVSWLRKVGDTADFARGQGQRASSTSLVLGVRVWF